MTAKRPAAQKIQNELIAICTTAQCYRGTATIFRRRYPRTKLQQAARAEYLTEAQYMLKLELTYQVKVEIDEQTPTHCLIFGNWEMVMLMATVTEDIRQRSMDLLPPAPLPPQIS